MASGGQREDGLTRHLSTLSVLAVVCVVCGLLPVTSPSPDSGEKTILLLLPLFIVLYVVLHTDTHTQPSCYFCYLLL